MAPVLPLGNSSDSVILPASYSGNAGVIFARQGHATDMLDLLFTHYGSAATIAAKRSPRVSEVMKRRAPFQVVRRVVQLVTVAVVNLWKPVGVRMKGKSYKAMNLSLNTATLAGQVSRFSGLAIGADGDAKISVAVHAPLQHAARTAKPTKAAGLVTRVSGDLAPFFIHNAGYSDVAGVVKDNVACQS